MRVGLAKQRYAARAGELAGVELGVGARGVEQARNVRQVGEACERVDGRRSDELRAEELRADELRAAAASGAPICALMSFMWYLKPNSGMSGSIRKSPPPERLFRSIPNQRTSLPRSKSLRPGSSSSPPSPVVRCLIACSEKTQRLPWVPSFCPPYSAPKAWAQSSITIGRKPKRW